MDELKKKGVGDSEQSLSLQRWATSGDGIPGLPGDGGVPLAISKGVSGFPG